MGVLSFFARITRKWPRILTYAVEIPSKTVAGVEIPPDATEENPNGIEFDNLYLDMNNIVHNCCHPQGAPAPPTEEDMLLEVWKALDRLMLVARPRKVLFLAVDGVAPRAKINQQRSRRFRSAFERSEEQKRWEEITADPELAPLIGKTIFPPSSATGVWDHNAITPGTPFMDKVTASLKEYVASRLNTNPAWRNLRVFLSPGSVPGEGEHKVMSFIRHERASFYENLAHEGDPDYTVTPTSYNPNTHHILYGMDADLIMLALASHEPFFWILRDEATFINKKETKDTAKESKEERQQSLISEFSTAQPVEDPLESTQIALQLIHIPILREYMRLQFNQLLQHSKTMHRNYWKEKVQPSGQYSQANRSLSNLAPGEVPIEKSLERVLDDVVFLFFFVGNDFLPHLPSLLIHEAALEKLMQMYSDIMMNVNGYLTDAGDINFEHLLPFLKRLGEQEDDVFRIRRLKELDYLKRNRSQRKDELEAKKREFNVEWSRHLAITKESKRLFKIERRREMKKKRESEDTKEMLREEEDDSDLLNEVVSEDGIERNPSKITFEEWMKAKEEEEDEEILALQENIGKTAPNFLRSYYRNMDQPSAQLLSSKSNRQSPSSARLSQSPASSTPQSTPTQNETQAQAPVPIPVMTGLTNRPPMSILPTLPKVAIDNKSAALALKQQLKQSVKEVEEEPIQKIKRDSADQETILETKKKMKIEDEDSTSSEDETVHPTKPAPAVSEDVTEEPEPEASFQYETPQGFTSYFSSADKVKLWEKGWKKRYYVLKEGMLENSDWLSDEDRSKGLVDPPPEVVAALHYLQGMQWTLHYYFRGVADWRWYYPRHYACFASDLAKTLEQVIANKKKPAEQRTAVQLKSEWNLRTPFTAFLQLSSILPAVSSHLLPLDLRWLIDGSYKNVDPVYPPTPIATPEQLSDPELKKKFLSSRTQTRQTRKNQMLERRSLRARDDYPQDHVQTHCAPCKESPLHAYTPSIVRLDLNGRQHAYQGVILLPFVPESVVVEAVTAGTQLRMNRVQARQMRKLEREQRAVARAENAKRRAEATVSDELNLLEEVEDREEEALDEQEAIDDENENRMNEREWRRENHDHDMILFRYRTESEWEKEISASEKDRLDFERTPPQKDQKRLFFYSHSDQEEMREMCRVVKDEVYRFTEEDFTENKFPLQTNPNEAQTKIECAKTGISVGLSALAPVDNPTHPKATRSSFDLPAILPFSHRILPGDTIPLFFTSFIDENGGKTGYTPTACKTVSGNQQRVICVGTSELPIPSFYFDELLSMHIHGQEPTTDLPVPKQFEHSSSLLPGTVVLLFPDIEQASLSRHVIEMHERSDLDWENDQDRIEEMLDEANERKIAEKWHEQEVILMLGEEKKKAEMGAEWTSVNEEEVQKDRELRKSQDLKVREERKQQHEEKRKEKAKLRESGKLLQLSAENAEYERNAKNWPSFARFSDAGGERGHRGYGVGYVSDKDSYSFSHESPSPSPSHSYSNDGQLNSYSEQNDYRSRQNNDRSDYSQRGQDRWRNDGRRGGSDNDYRRYNDSSRRDDRRDDRRYPNQDSRYSQDSYGRSGERRDDQYGERRNDRGSYRPPSQSEGRYRDRYTDGPHRPNAVDRMVENTLGRQGLPPQQPPPQQQPYGRGNPFSFAQSAPYQPPQNSYNQPPPTHYAQPPQQGYSHPSQYPPQHTPYQHSHPQQYSNPYSSTQHHSQYGASSGQGMYHTQQQYQQQPAPTTTGALTPETFQNLPPEQRALLQAQIRALLEQRRKQ